MHDHDTDRRARLARLSPEEKERLRRFLRGEITFAQLEGLTAADAQSIAETGHAFFRAGRLADARTIFEGLAALNPLDAYPHQVLGAVCEREGHPEAARRHYDVCLSLQPDDPWVLARRGELRLKSGDAQGALTDLTAAVRADRPPSLPATRRAAAILRAMAQAARSVLDGEGVARDLPGAGRVRALS